jgi:hypothetical protein
MFLFPLRVLPILGVLGVVALGGCNQSSRPTPLPSVGASDPSGTAACDASALGREYVGLDASVLSNVLFASPVRIIRPGDPVASDFIPNRVNFEIDARGIVARVTCG